MLNKIIFFIFVYLSLFSFLNSNAQVLFNMGNYRNLAYTSTGFNENFENITIGIARRDYVKLIKREVIGLLDASLPLSHHFFTRHAVRKGFQIDVYKKNDFKIPFMFASTSIVREDRYIKYHDITAEFSITPGIYTQKYSLALDIRYELIAFRLKKYHSNYFVDDGKHNINPNEKRHWECPLYSIAKVGIMAGINLKQFVAYIKTGYERLPLDAKKFNDVLPGYAVIGVGYKFGKKPFEVPKKTR